jgi:hypothetical protein
VWCEGQEGEDGAVGLKGRSISRALRHGSEAMMALRRAENKKEPRVQKSRIGIVMRLPCVCIAPGPDIVQGRPGGGSRCTGRTMCLVLFSEGGVVTAWQGKAMLLPPSDLRRSPEMAQSAGIIRIAITLMYAILVTMYR